MSDQAQPRRGGWLKAALIGLFGLGGGAAGTYGTAFLDRVAKPPRPVANFAVAADGLTVVCQNHASGESGWWDFGDGTALEPFDANQPEQKHTYAKPGNYTVKLTVRNFVADENERSVPVEVAAAAKDTPAPQIEADGTSRTLVQDPPAGGGSAKIPWEARFPASDAPNRTYRVTARQNGDQVTFEVFAL